MRQRNRGLWIAIITCGFGLLGGCDDGAEPELRLNFSAVVGGSEFACGQPFEVTGADGKATASFSDFRLYISDIELTSADGTVFQAPIVEAAPWQLPEVALLDFEDGTASCSGGTTEMNKVIRTTAPKGDYTAVHFTIGIPFALNHGDAASAPAPLNLSGLFWNWNGGYKFVRIDAKLDGARFVPFHLGSIGCAMDQATGTVKSCVRPNRPRVSLDGFNPEVDTIVIDAAALYAEVAVTSEDNEGCQSSPDTPECAGMLGAVGLSIEDATLKDTQTLFSVRAR